VIRKLDNASLFVQWKETFDKQARDLALLDRQNDLFRRAKDERKGRVFVPSKSRATGKELWLYFKVGKRYLVAQQVSVETSNSFNKWEAKPRLICTAEGKAYWQFRDEFYSADTQLNETDVEALLISRERRNQRQLNNARAMINSKSISAARRQAIPDDVKQFVFERDQGQCVNCGNRVELQFDHIIPVSLGGSSASENLQVLCGPCNRKKSGGLQVGN